MLNSTKREVSDLESGPTSSGRVSLNIWSWKLKVEYDAASIQTSRHTPVFSNAKRLERYKEVK